jgi:hypothetical protein
VNPTQVRLEERLGRLRGRALPRAHNARTISALAANPGCNRRALMDAAGADKQKLADHTGYPAPFGQSQFAITRGNAFEAQVKADGAAQLLALLRGHLGLDIAEAHYTDLNEVGGSENTELRHARTRQLLATVDERRGTMYDHPLLRLGVGGRHAYLEPDLIAFQLHGKFHVVEIKSFAVIDGQADPEKVAAAAIQSAVYVLALRGLLGGDPDRVHHETILVCPENFSNAPVATSIDVRKQLTVLRRQLSRIARIEDLLDACPGQLTFDLDPDENQVPRRQPAELLAAIREVPANYAPECLSTCELCFLCRDEARGTTGALGKSVREDLGGIEHVRTVLELARGACAGPDRAEVAVQLRHAALLREQILGAAV